MLVHLKRNSVGSVLMIGTKNISLAYFYSYWTSSKGDLLALKTFRKRNHYLYKNIHFPWYKINGQTIRLALNSPTAPNRLMDRSKDEGRLEKQSPFYIFDGFQLFSIKPTTMLTIKISED